MIDTKKTSRTGRRPSGEVAKKVVSLTIDPALIQRIDAYATDNGMSRSAAIETAITGLLTSESPDATAGNSLVQPDSCIFASPSMGTAIRY